MENPFPPSIHCSASPSSGLVFFLIINAILEGIPVTQPTKNLFFIFPVRLWNSSSPRNQLEFPLLCAPWVGAVSATLAVTNHKIHLTSVIIQVALHCAESEMQLKCQGYDLQRLICCVWGARLKYTGTALPQSTYYFVCLVQTFCWDGSSYANLPKPGTTCSSPSVVRDQIPKEQMQQCSEGMQK